MNNSADRNSQFSPSGHLRVLSACPFCSTHYSLPTAKIVAERDDAHLLHLECRKCGSAVVALVTTSGMGVSSVGLVTDLTSDDVLKFAGSEEVSVDDIIDFHLLLEQPAVVLSHVSEEVG